MTANWLLVNWRHSRKLGATKVYPKTSLNEHDISQSSSKLNKHNLWITSERGNVFFFRMLYSNLEFTECTMSLVQPPENLPLIYTFLEQCAISYLFDWQRDVLQYAVLYFQLIHHWTAGSPHSVSWLRRCTRALVLLFEANAAHSS